jgi:hypothetical protein
MEKKTKDPTTMIKTMELQHELLRRQHLEFMLTEECLQQGNFLAQPIKARLLIFTMEQVLPLKTIHSAKTLPSTTH